MNVTPGKKGFTVKHGGKGTRLYNIWKGMRRRCFNCKDASYKNYGGRGISICADWDDFSIFRDWALSRGYTDILTIERINNDGNYTPDNCCWIPLEQQRLNTRPAISNFTQGKRINLKGLARNANINYGTLRGRLIKGVELDFALSKSVELRTSRGGFSNTALHSAWRKMIDRCDNPKNKVYFQQGGRGIVVCPEWYTWETFAQWAKSSGFCDGRVLYRLNSDKGYNPVNCRWGTRQDQARCRAPRVSQHTNGENLNLSALARQYGLKVCTVYRRLKAGMSLEVALSTPVKGSVL